MKNGERNIEKKQPYVEPKVLATYIKEELDEAIKPHGPLEVSVIAPD